ncbi:EAL domain-containing response regulator [Montanilutibacter psychrotolerans]|uniref:EAL domain-containing protein n=1 Tax=Montanilutibacter psychrotolerans TaxID=1327343 RepID=A0A3M8SQV6_9GAMM|nr:EAL domain-containing response regulator [Lysobacter psychrotolerans]RNF83659.1 EAL domain-containing protein [Lysobacter psychrotolerans]
MSISALSVMVVEDHGFQRRMALRLLAELGVSGVDEAADGNGALESLRRRAQPPDVVMVDLDMPGMDGIEFIGHVAQHHLARSVVVVSALDPALLNTVQTMARAYGLRVLGSVEKPLTLDKLTTTLASYHDTLLAAEDDEEVVIGASTIRDAIALGEIEPWFQPQVEFANGKPVGVEALARWRRPDGRIVRPLHFIGLIEREGLVDALTDHMLQQACRHKREWDRTGLRLNLSVNVSPTTLALSAAADRFQRIVQHEGVDPSEVVIEITESSVMTDAARALGVLARLRLKGFGLSIDDFGTGYSSLAQLSQIPFTELKIDQGFVQGAHAQPRKRAVVEASLDLARKLDLKVVAEGVETVDDWQMLAVLGCGMAQGNLISQPVPPEQLQAALGRWRRPE